MSWLSRLLSPFRRSAPPASPVTEVKSIPRYEPAWVMTLSSATRPDDAQVASAWVYACADRIATALSALPLVIRRRSTGEVVDWMSADPLPALLREPIPDTTWSAWMEEVALSCVLTGACIVEKRRARALGVSAKYPGKGIPAQLWPYPSPHWKVEVDKDDRRRPIEYYEPKTGLDRTKVPPSEIVRIAYTRLGKRGEALSKVEPAQSEINADRGAADWQLAALKNRGVPDGGIKLKGTISPAQEAEVYNHIQTEWTGSRNAHRPIVLGADADWIDFAKSAVEMEMMAGRRFTRAAICATMGVPEVIFEASSATYANLETALLILVTQAVMPLAGRIVDGLNLGVCAEIDPDLYLEIDDGAVDALLPILRARWEVAAKALAAGVPLSQLSDTLRLGVEPYRGWDVGLVPSSSVPVSAIADGYSDADLGLTGGGGA